MLVSFLLLAAAPEITVADILDSYWAHTRADIQCTNPNPGDEIMVCGARKADRYRVPLIGYELGDPRGETVEAERERLQHRTTACQDRGPFLIGCGFVGVTGHASFGAAGIGTPTLRPMAR